MSFGSTDSPGVFLAPRPEWTLHDAVLTRNDGVQARVQQVPFRWTGDGAWTAEVSILPEPTASNTPPTSLILRVTPDTLRRWKDVGINPFLEASAQLRDHLRSARANETSTLTLL